MFYHTFRYRQFFFLLFVILFFLSQGQLWASNIHQLRPTNTTPTITIKPDLLLVPHSLRLNKLTVTPGEVVIIRATVHNQDGKILNRVRVRFSCGQESKDVFINLRPKQRKQVQESLPIPGPVGTKIVGVEVNPLHSELSERNFSNNRDTARISVTGVLPISQKDSLKIQPKSSQFQTSNRPSTTKFPVLTGVYPKTLKPGKEYALKLTGRYIKKGITLDFGTGIKIKGTPVTFDGYILASVSVNSNATPGKKQIRLNYHGKKKVQRPTLTILAGERLAIKKITPSTLLQGQRYLLIIQGKGFQKNMSMHHDHEIKALGKLRVINGEKAQQEVQIIPSAHLGAHTLTLSSTHPSQKAVSTVQIIKKLQSPSLEALEPAQNLPARSFTLPPRLTSINPARWMPGKKYTITIQGSQLDQVNALHFGPDIVVKQLQHQDSSSMSCTVTVASAAKIGVIPLFITHREKQLNSGLNVWVIKKRTKHRNPPTITWVPKSIEIQQGVIYLTAPDWQYGGDVSTIKPLPVLNDKTLFTWREQTAGLADLFEIRFFTPQRKFVHSQIINMGTPKIYTTAFKPTNEFITELLKKQQSATTRGKLALNPPKTIGGVHVVSPSTINNAPQENSQTNNGIHYTFQKATFSPVATDKNTLHPMSPMEKYISDKGDEVDLLWQVVGYKRVVSNDNAIVQNSSLVNSKKTLKQTGTTDLIEIEVSEQWPLGLPEAWPSGVTCDAQNRLSLVASGSHNNGADPSDINHYPGDTIKVEGTFSIKNSPWAVSAKTTYKGGEIIEDNSYSFNNIIIDWGDGIHWQRLKATATESSGGNPHSNLPGWTSSDLMKTSASHQYTAPGDYQIRIYVVPDDEMGHISSIVAAHGYRPPDSNIDVSKKSAKQAPSATQLTTKVNTSSFKPKPISQTHQISMAGSRIFMLYCDPLPVTITQDTAATGPLNLDSIEITTFSTDSKPINGSQQTGKISLNNLTLQEQVTALSMHVTSAPNSIISGQNDTTVSTCSGGLWATGKLKYFGQGYANIQWFVDTILVDSKLIKIGPSKFRQNIQSPGSIAQGTPLYSSITIHSPRLPVKETGGHKIVVRATVTEDPTFSLVNSVSLRSSMDNISKQRTPGTKSSRASVPTSSTNFQPTFLPALSSKDLLKPSSASETKNMFTTLKKRFRKNSSFTHLVANPPFSVISKEKRYLVKESDSNSPCRFLFSTLEGNFEINDLRKLQVQGTQYSGNGLLLLTLADGPHSNGEQPVRIPFQNWQVDNTFTVQQGVLKADLQENLDELPGMRATLTGLQGNAGKHVHAVMNVELQDTTIRLLGAEVPQKWTNVSSILTPKGDWYADELSLGKSLIGWSMTSIESKDIRLDLSRSEGEEVSCGTGGKDWVGVHLGNATLYPYLFDLTEMGLTVNDWGITADGLCGHAEATGFNTPFGDGAIGWDKLSINAYKSSLSGYYKNFFVKMAWPKVHLQSKNAHYSYTPGNNVKIQLGMYDLPVIKEHYEHIDMEVTPESFSRKEEGGWGLLADVELTFRDDQQTIFAEDVSINDLFFTIHSEALYGGPSIGLNIQGQLGGADEVISAMDVTTGSSTEKRKLSLDFTTKFRMEGLGEAEHPVHILYGINKEQGGDAYSTSPVLPTEIIIRSEFPDGDPITTNTFTINYKSDSEQLTNLGKYPMYAANFGYASVFSDAWPNMPLLATTGSVSGGACGNDTFGGTVDTKMFAGSGKSIAGTFRFGEENSSRYWLTFFKGDNLHQHIYAGVFLEMVQGGLAYNFNADALIQDNGFGACPDPGKKLLFSSGIGLSFTSTDVIRADGVLTIQPTESFYQYEVDVKLFNSADLSGRLRYHQSAFDGEVWGTASLFENMVYLEAQEHGSGIHIDSGSWLFTLGTEALPTQGHILSVNGGVFMKLGNKVGFKAGGSYTQSLGDDYCCWGGFGVKGHADLTAAVDFTLNPAQINGTLSGNVHGKFVNPIKDIGLGVGVNGLIGCCNPTKLGFGFSKKCCCVEGGGDLTILPSPGFAAWAEWYCGKFW